MCEPIEIEIDSYLGANSKGKYLLQQKLWWLNGCNAEYLKIKEIKLEKERYIDKIWKIKEKT